MPTTSIQQPQKNGYCYVRIVNPGAVGTTTFRYTDSSSNRLFDDLLGGSTFTYVATPDMDIKLGLNAGSTEDKITTIDMTKDTFLARVSDGTAYAKTAVTIWEVMDSDLSGSPTTIWLFRGRLMRTIRNYNGQADRVRIECSGVKTQLKVAMGLPANHHCTWTFGDNSSELGVGVAGRNCAINIKTLYSSGTLTAISAKQATITGLTTPAAPAGQRYWHRGYVLYDGLRILVRDWDLGTPTIFQLANFPPQSWIGQTVKVYPGCDKTIETCRLRWNNEANFMGIGYAIPSRIPTYEKG